MAARLVPNIVAFYDLADFSGIDIEIDRVNVRKSRGCALV